MKSHINKKFARQLATGFWMCVDRMISVFEVLGLLAFKKQLENAQTPPPVFIIGAPRSGTTLLYQLLINRYMFVYFSNLTAKLSHAPILATWIVKKIFYSSSQRVYTSRHGQIHGWRAPHEAGDFWYRWFPKGKHVYVPPGSTDKSKLAALRRDVKGMAAVTGLPVLFKNTFNSMRIAPIMEAFPQACFLLCQREPIDVAQSILKSRVQRFDSKRKWWSVPPKEIDEIESHPYYEQVAEQVFYIYKQISTDSARFGADKFYDVKYDDLCREPRRVLEDIEQFLASKGIDLTQHAHDVPAEFAVSTGQQVSDEDYYKIEKKVHELWS